jgi:ketopantoate reductase
VNNRNLGLIGLGIGAVGFCYAAYLHMRLKNMEDVIESSINNISKDVNIDIPETMVDKAVNRAMEREVEKAVRAASHEVISRIRKDIQSEVRASVNESYSDIRKSVSDEIAKQVANMDLRPLRDDVKEKAKQMIVEKFNENLDSLLQDFNQNLTNVSKIYGSIADSMASKKSDPVIKIGI